MAIDNDARDALFDALEGLDGADADDFRAWGESLLAMNQLNSEVAGEILFFTDNLSEAD